MKQSHKKGNKGLRRNKALVTICSKKKTFPELIRVGKQEKKYIKEQPVLTTIQNTSDLAPLLRELLYCNVGWGPK